MMAKIKRFLAKNRPATLALVGDRVRILATGAYTSGYRSGGFNGFPPTVEHCI